MLPKPTGRDFKAVKTCFCQDAIVCTPAPAADGTHRSPPRHRSVSGVASEVLCSCFTRVVLPFHRRVVPLQLVENKSSDSASEQWGPPQPKGVNSWWSCSNGKEKHCWGNSKFYRGHKNKPFLRGKKNFLISKQRIDVMSGPIETSAQVANLGQTLFFRANWP